MMRKSWCALHLLAFAVLIAVMRPAIAQEIHIGLSSDTVAISSSFDGTEIVIFGTIEGADPKRLADGKYDVAVVLLGPLEPVVVRRKEHRFGIWANGKSMRFENVPSSYSVATTRALDRIATPEQAKVLQIGLANVQMKPLLENIEGPDVAIFSESLKRIKTNNSLYVEKIGGVDFVSNTLFRARVPVPANVPIGLHRARAFLFSDGQVVNAKSVTLQVRKIGFEQFTYNMAHQNGLLYGIIAVLVAVGTGWLANVIFQKD